MNPFAKKLAEQRTLPLEEEAALVREAQGSGIVATMSAALESVAKDAMIHRTRTYRFRYGGMLKRSSVKQRTRYNREQRNAR